MVKRRSKARRRRRKDYASGRRTGNTRRRLTGETTRRSSKRRRRRKGETHPHCANQVKTRGTQCQHMRRWRGPNEGNKAQQQVECHGSDSNTTAANQSQ